MNNAPETMSQPFTSTSCAKSGRKLLQVLEHRPEQSFSQHSVATLIGMGKVVATRSSSSAQSRKRTAVQSQRVTDVVKADSVGQLREKHADDMTPCAEGSRHGIHPGLACEFRNKMRRNEIAKLPKNAEFGCGRFGVSFFHLCRVTELKNHSNHFFLCFNQDFYGTGVIDETMAAIEAGMKTKVRKGYQQENRVSSNMVYAKFIHGETRPVDGIPDPHYHVHVFAMNATFDEVEKEWKALEVGNTVGDRTFYEAYFHHLLATKLETSGYGIRRTEHHFELASVNRELVEKFSRRTKLIEQRARDRYTVLEAQARALMKSTNMAFDDAFAHVVDEIGGDWDKWKSELGARDRESKNSAKYKVREELVIHWQSEMTAEERESLRPKCVRSAFSQNLLDTRAAKELAIQHLFEQVSLKRELHVAGMLLRRGIARVPATEALTWVKSDPLFFRPDPDGRLVTTREIQDAEEKMIRLAAEGQDRHEALGGGKEWVIRNPLVGASRELRSCC